MARSTRWLALGVALCLGGQAFAILPGEDVLVRRGDSNNDGVVNITDVTFISDYLFNGGDTPPCLNQADVDDNGALELTDPIYLSSYLFEGGPAPPAPGVTGKSCYIDQTRPNLGCYSDEAWACLGY